MTDPLVPLRRLSRALQLKIIPPTDERTDCWIWTGAVRKARTRVKPLPLTPEERKHPTRGRPASEDRISAYVEKPLPVISNGKWLVGAHRRVYGESYKLTELGELSRCSNPLCVSPHHNLPRY